MIPSGWKALQEMGENITGCSAAAAAASLSARMAFLFFESLNFLGRSGCRSSVEMANLMVSKTSKYLISSHPTLCGGFLLVLLMTFIAVANKERTKKKKKALLFLLS